MIKNITIIILAILLAVVTYCLGYVSGKQHTILRSDARFRIFMNDALYHYAEQGDVRHIQSALGMVLLGEVLAYQSEFGDEAGTNSFAKRYDDAKAIADHVESTLVPLSSITNALHAPNMKVTIEQEKN